MLSRANRSALADWWWTVDRTMLMLVLLLLGAGMVFSLAASPAVAERLGLDSSYFILRHALYAPLAGALLVAASMLTARQVRRAALALLVAGIGLMVMVLFVGAEVNGARRWLTIAGISVQPSELVKPAFIVMTAWLLTEGTRRPEIPGRLIATVLLAILVSLLAAQPDLGQAVLVVAVWGAIFFLAGLPLVIVAILGAAGLVGLYLAYVSFPHVASRIDRFLDPSSGDTYQTDTALEAFMRGGWAGSGPGEGVMKRVLPDSHTDFIFAVVAEEFGILFCLALVALFAALLLRAMLAAFRRRHEFERVAISGLAIQIALQAFVNIGVNLHVLPAKGMTLPFISYGGSALLSAALSMGFLLALSRRRPEVQVNLAPRTVGVGVG
ncbi:MAG TPA: putative lipid II flippase FtsW [Afifellaceae bacterium]|nr:putative lipid II flippase FtsW [Afifellaceae bacterium]